MRDAWQGRDVRLVCDPTARNTMQNAAGIAALARELGVDEVVVVTSQWHAPRAGALVRAALGDADVVVSTSSPRGPQHPWLLARELACLAALPYQRRRVSSVPPRSLTAVAAGRLSRGAVRSRACVGCYSPGTRSVPPRCGTRFRSRSATRSCSRTSTGAGTS